MSNNLAAVLRLHWMDTRYAFAIFWSTLIGFELIFCLLVWFYGDGMVMFSGWMAVYGFAFAGGVMTVQSTFPVALGWSVPRKDYYLATMLHYVLACVALSVIYMIMYGIENVFGNMLTGGRVKIFTLPIESEPSVWFLLWFHFIVALTMLTQGHFFSCLYYRYGRLGLFAFFAILVLLVILFHFLKVWDWIARLLSAITFEEFLLWLVPLNAVVLASAWLFLRKAPSKKAS